MSGQHNSKNWPQENGEKNWPWSWRLTGLETIKMTLTQPATWLQQTLAHSTSLFQGGWDWFTNLLFWISSGSGSVLEEILKLEFYLLVKGILIVMMSHLLESQWACEHTREYSFHHVRSFHSNNSLSPMFSLKLQKTSSSFFPRHGRKIWQWGL